MSIYFEFEVGKTGRRLRRAIESDKYDIEALLDRSCTNALFGDVNIGALIELSVLPICMINENKDVTGFIALSDHPNVSSVDPADWEYWIRNMYKIFYLSRNTLFIHFMYCIEAVKAYFLEEALTSVFYNDCYLLEIVLVKPIFCPEELIKSHGTFKKHIYQRHRPVEIEDKFVGNELIVAVRREFCPKIKIRRAVEEDNDDLVEILDKSCPRLKKIYGEYYISELIGRHPESARKILVGDVHERAVSVMCLNTDINYRKLQKIYELRPFYGLNAASPLEKEKDKRANELLKMFGEPIVKGIPYLFDSSPKHAQSQESIQSRDSITNTAEPGLSKVSFNKEKQRVRSIDPIEYKATYDDDELSETMIDYTNLDTSQIAIDMLDDDPFDYDIVNIDKNWLKDVPSWVGRPIPSVLSIGKAQVNTTSSRRIVKKPKVKSKHVKINEKWSTIHQGARNAFMIELFAFREDIDERSYSLDMLEVAFELMKEYEYCIIEMPSSERYFPLLDHFCLVPTRQRECGDHALYVTHRSSVMGKLRVRQAEVVDLPSIASLLHPLESGKHILEVVQHQVFSNDRVNQAYVFTSGLSVVGLGLLELPTEVDFLRGRFNIDAHQVHKYSITGHGIDAGYATIKSILVYPVFETHYRFFARELMRLSGNNTLVYFTSYRNKWSIKKGNAIVSSMIPLMPRRFEYDNDAIRNLEKHNVYAMSEAIEPFSAWYIGRKFTSVPKVNVTTRIVIIGASTTATGFLQSLLFEQPSTYVTFTNVTLISPYGLPYMKHRKLVAESMFQNYHTRTDKYMKSIPFTYYVNVIQGKMLEINLQEKSITLTSGNHCHYDLLFLFFGKQYQHPNYMDHLLEKEKEFQSQEVPKYIPLDVPRFSDTEIQITSDDTPENVFIINHMQEAHKALTYIKNNLTNLSEIIVYGSTIHVYLCINALLAIHVPPANITFIEPFPSEDDKKARVSAFCNANVDNTMMQVLENLKIKVYRSFHFQSWSLLEYDNIITHADFLSHYEYLHLECSALFYYGKVGIDMGAFVALHKSGLAYDGGILIDLDCRTRDPSVYAAGPHTRYRSRFYADCYAHKYFDSYEIGFKLGMQIRNQLDPLFNEPKSDSHENSKNEPEQKETDAESNSCNEPINKNMLNLKKPKVTNCVLPGGFKFLDVCSPGAKLPHRYLQSLQYNGFVMQTFKNGYFKLHFTKDLCVDGITCLTSADCTLEKFTRLYGRSATVLKNVHVRYTAKKLDDFYEFFRAPWASFLYHDHVEDLFTMAKELFPMTQDHVIKQTIKGAFYDSLKANSVGDDDFKSPYVEQITEYVINWLSRNDLLLPMYLQPWQSSQFSHGLVNFPVFRARKDQGKIGSVNNANLSNEK